MEDHTAQHKADSFSVFVLLILLMATIMTVWALKKKQIRTIHESAMSIIYGVLIGCFVRFTPGEMVQNEVVFDPELFFYLLLPPIVFHAGYSLNREYFFRNFGAILMFSLCGTFLSCVTVGAIVFPLTVIFHDSLGKFLSIYDCMRFGALISSTNPMAVLALMRDFQTDPDLYSLLFGESLLNNAVSIVLYTSIVGMGAQSKLTLGTAMLNFASTFLGSFSLGVLIALITAIFLKYTTIRKYDTLESALFFVLSYSSYLIAEGFGMSGIVSVLFCGIVQAHYSYHNLSPETQLRTRELFELLNFMAENMVLSYLGISLFSYSGHVFKPLFVLWSLFAILVARAVNIFPLAYLYNFVRRKNPVAKINIRFQMVIWFAGIRGAIPFALAMQSHSSPADRIILSTTLVIVLCTVIAIGAAAHSVMDVLGILETASDPSGMVTYFILFICSAFTASLFHFVDSFCHASFLGSARI